MINKEFQHNRIECCCLCKKEIDTTKEKYIALLDYNKSNLYSKGFYHLKCLKDIISGQGKVIQERCKKQMMSLMPMAKGIVDNILGREDKQVVYVN